MGTVTSKPDAMAPGTTPHLRAFQMLVVKISDVLNMASVMVYEELQKASLLHAHQLGWFTVFVSHQWLGLHHPDRAAAQFKVLQNALQGAIDGSVKVQSDTVTEFMKAYRFLSPRERNLLRDGYMWMDWFCIPQDPACRDQLNLAVESIPSYIDCCELFVVLVPPLRHETGRLCNFESWLQRGWCRAELWCNRLCTNANLGVIVVQGAADATFLAPQDWIHRPVHTGDFTVDSDRQKVMRMLREAMDVYITHLRQCKMHDLLRFYTARYHDLLGLPRAERSPEEFLASFGFRTMEEAIKSAGMTALGCAAMAGDRSIVRMLLEAKAQLSKRHPNLQEVDQFPGQTPLHFAVLRGIGSADVITELLRSRADPNVTCSIGMPVMSNCKDPETVELLVSHRADVNHRSGLIRNTALAVCCCKLAPVPVVAKLLELRADPNLSQGGESTTPLMAMSIYTKGQSQYAVEVAGLLVRARADVNQAQRASGVWRFAELICRASQCLGKDSALVRYFAENSSTPLGIAGYYANEPMVSFLLSARADVNHRNHRGHTPLMLAAKGHTSHLFVPEPSSSEKEQGLASTEDEEMFSRTF
ncbi:unnamed protein product [Symbiodinium sp. CCMP2456]|nr:unnamed protein product [Symbiodinium sp. CCMP2456]